jgi:ATP-dependent Clp protease protease subunit
MKKLLILAFALFLAQGCTKSEAKSETITLSKSNTLVLNDEVNDETVAKITATALAMDEKLDDGDVIYLVLNTPGGSVTAGLELIDNLKALGRPINTVTIFAASMGFQIAQGLNQRLITSNGVLMSHRARGGMQGEFGGQAPSQFEQRFAFWNNIIKELDMVTVARTKGKQTLQSYQAAYENELWLTGKYAVEQGYADQVRNVKCDNSLTGTKVETFAFFGLVIDLVVSECPLITGPLEVQVNIIVGGKKVPLNEFQQKNGQMGAVCINQLKTGYTTTMCADDPMLTMEKIEQLRKQTLEKKKVVFYLVNKPK